MRQKPSIDWRDAEGSRSIAPVDRGIAPPPRGSRKGVRPLRPDGVRYRLAKWMGDGSSLVVVSDEGGEDGIEIHKAGEAIGWRLEPLDLGCITDLATPPTGVLVAVANHRHELHLVDLDAGTSRLLDRSGHGALDGVVWSPDGKWLAYSCAATARSPVQQLAQRGRDAAHADPDRPAGASLAHRRRTGRGGGGSS